MSFSDPANAESHSRFAKLYDGHYRHVYAYCRRRLSSDDVDDAVAEVFLVMWRRIADVPPDDRVLPWLYGVAHRVVRHRWRGTFRRSRLNERLSGLGLEQPRAVEEYIVTRHESKLALQAVSRLTPTDQEILRLAAWEELGNAEIAEALDLSAGAVRQRLYKARKNLAREYRKLERKRIPSPAAEKGGG